MAQCKPDSFYSEATKAAYNRLRAVARKEAQFPIWEELCADPVLKEQHRKTLANSDSVCATNKRQCEKLAASLEKYRKLRNMYLMCESTIDLLSEDSVDFDALLDSCSDTLMSLRVGRTSIESNLLHIGVGNNSASLIKSRLQNNKPTLVPTGFRAFDDRNGGFNYGSLVTVGATTGGGKTAVASIQLLLNMSRYEPAVLVSLEMTDAECADRILANLGGVAVNKFGAGTLTASEKNRASKAYAKFVKEQKQRNTRYSIWSPDEDVTIEEVLYGLLPFGFRVMLIDYIGLLKGVDGDDQWKQLSNACRFAKVFAKTHNVIVIILCQVSEDGQVRYAKAIAEHSNNLWLWVYTEASRESGLLDITQPKARNQDPTPFQLWHDFAYMRCADVDNKDIPQDVAERSAKNRAKLDAVSEEVRSFVLEMGDDDE
jgi:replicative DNA helicase